MQASSRSRDTGASFAVRKGHAPQLSISDDNHHVTETIGYMYGDESEHDARGLANAPSGGYDPFQHNGNMIENGGRDDEIASRRTSIPRKQLPQRELSNGNYRTQKTRPLRPMLAREGSWEQQNGLPISPIGSRDRSPSDTANAQFPLTDIDYESSPAAVAQELSNLQALRRMSMDVGATGDPDLPQLSAAGMPNAPSSSASEDDASRLFWVPARLHPELAPKEFKTFLESKAEQIKRRSGELSAFATPTSSRTSSLSAEDKSSGLRRKKSMLSRQINSSVGYQDGAERLERKKSQSQRNSPTDPNLQELESLVAQTNGEERLSLDEPGNEESGDIILPSVPGSSLKRSTRTTYRRGGSINARNSDRSTYAQRAARRAATGTGDATAPLISPSESADPPPMPSFNTSDFPNLAQTLQDPSNLSNANRGAQNFSRLAGRSPSPPSATLSSIPTTFENLFNNEDSANRLSTSSMPESKRPLGLSKSPPLGGARIDRQSIPQIVEVPPNEELTTGQRPSSMPVQSPAGQGPLRHPERISSREDKSKILGPQRPGMPPKQTVPTGRPPSRGNALPPQSKTPQSLDQPSPLPGNDTNTGNLSFIPTLTVDKRADHKKKDEQKKSSWGWLLGKEDGDKDKSDKPKAKIQKPPQSHDNTRLDVLQTSIDGRGRESLVLDRESLKLEEERKKESQRKSSGVDQKKEKEGLFSSIFGGKKKAEKEANSRKNRDRGLSPEPPYRELKPDIDYNWTRFSILEERAIYRMAHIKLANPRRALYSQVLLSNFMYSYLAKVQQMHPQMNLPTSAKQQRKQQQKDQQPEEFTQYQRYQQQQAQQQGQQPPQQSPAQQNSVPIGHQQYNQQQDYEGDSSTVDYDTNSQRPSSRASKHNPDSNPSTTGDHNQYYHNGQQQQQQHQYGTPNDDDDDEMW